MINKEVLNKVYNKFLATNVISIRELIELGLTSDDIKILCLLKYIGMDEIGNYVINNIESLFRYGQELLQSGYKKEAYAIFKKCYELDNTYEDVLYELYFNALDNSNYQESFTYFKNLSVGKSKHL